jgi:hypothetical protein
VLARVCLKKGRILCEVDDSGNARYLLVYPF